MNEEELKKEIEILDYKIKHNVGTADNYNFIKLECLKAELKGFQKGKLEQKKEEFAFLNGVLKLPEVWALVIAKRLKQLQKEIGGIE